MLSCKGLDVNGFQMKIRFPRGGRPLRRVNDQNVGAVPSFRPDFRTERKHRKSRGERQYAGVNH